MKKVIIIICTVITVFIVMFVWTSYYGHKHFTEKNSTDYHDPAGWAKMKADSLEKAYKMKVEYEKAKAKEGNKVKHSTSSADTPDDAYQEGYNNGYSDGFSDVEDNNEYGESYDDSNDYYNNYEDKYIEGYEEGYREGYQNGQ